MTETTHAAGGAARTAIARCRWANGDPLYEAYHDTEWGTAVYGDDAVFERIALEGFQAGLSWITILRKRERFREVFCGFSVEAVAGFGPTEVDSLLQDAGIIRNRAKIEATIGNARAALELPQGLSSFVWSFAPPRDSRVATTPRSTSDEATALSTELKKRGFRFVGPTTMYAAFQAMGLVNDHEEGCFLANTE